MASVNKVIILGNVGRDPELSETSGGMKIASFSIATTSRSKNGDKTEWHAIKAFGRTAEVAAQYLKKGNPVYIEGSLATSNWEKDGVKHSKTEILCNTLQLLGGKGNAGESAPAPTASRPTASAIPETYTDDIPF